MRHRSTLAALLVYTVAACADGPAPVGLATAPDAASLSQGGAPEPWPPFPSVDPYATELCGATVLQEVTGRFKVLEFPNGRQIWIAPANKVTWTNTITGKTVTRTTTGTLHVNPLPNGDTELVLTGHTPLYDYDPVAGAFFYDYLSGRFTTVIGADGSVVQPWEGSGKRTPVCELVS